MIAQARKREIDMEMERKRKPESVSGTMGSGKNPKLSAHRSRGQQSHNRCGKCGRLHDEVFKAGSSGCFKCGWTGHMSRDCTATTTTTTSSGLICFNCNQRGHKNSQCLILASVGQVAAHAPTTLRITDGHQGRVEVLVAKSRAFQLIAKEARAAPNVVTGSFLGNDISSMVLFDSGATRSFVSLALSKRFSRAPRELDCLLDVEIADDRIVKVTRVHRGCALHMFHKQF
ncbi:uncharacterized protein LOC128133625 [Lactuca sativa]|uniref:uncharacterized protein LOC128133625 n=1 Tax=Lactuca sativa TaxID=4236 RepID=UPI0022AF08F4|nr:uncharacterized protein LOC128133625 [Lactuca sativa]